MATPLPASLRAPLQSLLSLGREWQPSQVPVWQRYAVALLLTALAAWARMALAPVEAGGRFIIMSLAVALAALYGGFRAGMLSTVASMLLVNYLMVRPYASFAAEAPRETLWFNFWFLVNQLVVVGAIALMQHRNARLRVLEWAHQRSHQQLEDSFERSAIGIAHHEIDGRWIRVNPSYCRLVGYTREELMALALQDISHPDELGNDRALLKRLLAGETTHAELERRYVHRLGHVVWVQLTLSLVRQPGGAPDYLITVAQDITQRKETEEALLNSELVLRQAQHLAGLLTLECDVVARRFTVVAGAREVLGFELGEFTDTEMLARTHPEDRPRVMQAWADAVLHSGLFKAEYRVTYNGRERWYGVRAQLQRDAQGRAIRGLGVVQDVTDFKTMELENQRLKASLAQQAACCTDVPPPLTEHTGQTGYAHTTEPSRL